MARYAQMAPLLFSVKSGFTTLVNKQAMHVISTHCVLHRHAQASKVLPEYLMKIVLKRVTERVNYIKTRACRFQILRFRVRVLGHASIYGSDASYASGPSNQISFNLGPSKVGGLGPLLSSKSLPFATLRMSSGRNRPTSTVYVLGLTVNCLQCCIVELCRV